MILGSEALVVERKIVTDFLSSVRSNRLWDQLLRMIKTKKVLGYPMRRRMLLIQGNFEDVFESEHKLIIHQSQLIGA